MRARLAVDRRRVCAVPQITVHVDRAHGRHGFDLDGVVPDSRAGPLLFNLLSPVLFAGLMLGCKALEQGEELELGHLFAGFQNNATALVTIGGVYLVGSIVILGAVWATAGGSMLQTVMQKSPADIQMIAGAVRSMALALLVGFALYLPLLMRSGLRPSSSSSMHETDRCHETVACRMLTNWLAFLVYGAIFLVLWFVASIPLFWVWWCCCRSCSVRFTRATRTSSGPVARNPIRRQSLSALRARPGAVPSSRTTASGWRELRVCQHQPFQTRLAKVDLHARLGTLPSAPTITPAPNFGCTTLCPTRQASED